MENLVNRYWRYAKYMARYLFRERLFGLDFSMRDKSLLKKTNGVMHGYSITPQGHIDEILGRLDYTKNTAFLDVGCGKGFVLKSAAQRPFQRCDGVEYDERIAGICKKNLRRLKIENVQIFCGDAREFEEYGKYDTFFFFNPFGEEIFQEVLKKIPTGGSTIIYHNPTCHQLIMDTGCFRLKEQLYDPEKDYYTNIYESVT